MSKDKIYKDITVDDYMTIVVTHECNRKCAFCVDIYRGNEEYITLDNVDKALKFAVKNNIKDILLVGGEPSLHPDIIEIARMVKSYGLTLIYTTNFDDLDTIYELDKYVDHFNFSYYEQDVVRGGTGFDFSKLPNPSKIKNASTTLSYILHSGRVKSKEDLDNIIDRYSERFDNLKFTTLTNVNDFTEAVQIVPFLEEIETDEDFIAFGEIVVQVYRGYEIKRYDKVINESAKQSWKCHADGEMSRTWVRTNATKRKDVNRDIK